MFIIKTLLPYDLRLTRLTRLTITLNHLRHSNLSNANLSNEPTLQLPVIGDESHFPNAGPLNETPTDHSNKFRGKEKTWTGIQIAIYFVLSPSVVPAPRFHSSKFKHYRASASQCIDVRRSPRSNARSCIIGRSEVALAGSLRMQ